MAKARTRYKTLGRKVEGAAHLVLIADEGAARLLRLSGSKNSEVLVELAVLKEHSARRPAAPTGSRRGAPAEDAPNPVEPERFAKRLATRLDSERRKGTFGSLTIVASRHFLGLLRPHLSKPTQLWTSREIAKDLVHADDAHILRAVLL